MIIVAFPTQLKDKCSLATLQRSETAEELPLLDLRPSRWDVE